MLVISRDKNESIILKLVNVHHIKEGEEIEVMMLSKKGKIGIDAPIQTVRIIRSEKESTNGY